MKVDLSVLLPVCAADDRLEEKVRRLVDTLADEACRFEVLLVEQNPCEAGSELARSLAAEFAQVRRMPNAQLAGQTLDEAAQQAAGRVVLIHEAGNLDADSVLKMYRAESGIAGPPGPSDRLKQFYRSRNLLPRDQLASAVRVQESSRVRHARLRAAGGRPMMPTQAVSSSVNRRPLTWEQSRA